MPATHATSCSPTYPKRDSAPLVDGSKARWPSGAATTRSSHVFFPGPSYQILGTDIVGHSDGYCPSMVSETTGVATSYRVPLLVQVWLRVLVPAFVVGVICSASRPSSLLVAAGVGAGLWLLDRRATWRVDARDEGLFLRSRGRPCQIPWETLQSIELAGWPVPTMTVASDVERRLLPRLYREQDLLAVIRDRRWQVAINEDKRR